MKNNNNTLKNRILLTFLAGFILLISAILIFYPLLFLEQSIKNGGVSNNSVTYAATNNNPFSPKISTIVELEDNTYWIIVEDYERTGLFEIKATGKNGKKTKESDFGAIDAYIEGYSKDEVFDLVRRFDLSKENPDPDNINTKVITETPERETNEEHYFSVSENAENNPEITQRNYSKNITLGEIETDFGLKSFRGVCGGLASGNCEKHYKIESENILYIAFEFDDKYLLQDGSSNPDSQLKAIYLVKKDGTFEKVSETPQGEIIFIK